MLAALLTAACEQLGNPEQYATGPTPWKDANGHLITTTRSFKDAATIRRLVSDGLESLDHADASIGPNETLTVVIVVPRAFRGRSRERVRLVTIFKVDRGPPIQRRWSAPTNADRWSAAFALPAVPTGAITSVAP